MSSSRPFARISAPPLQRLSLSAYIAFFYRVPVSYSKRLNIVNAGASDGNTCMNTALRAVILQHRKKPILWIQDLSSDMGRKDGCAPETLFVLYWLISACCFSVQ